MSSQKISINNVFESSNGWRVSATVDEHTFHVEVNQSTLQRLGGKTPEDLVVSSLRFLLARETVDQILSEFNLTDINKYFPEYENLVSEY